MLLIGKFDCLATPVARNKLILVDRPSARVIINYDWIKRSSIAAVKGHRKNSPVKSRNLLNNRPVYYANRLD